MAGVGGQGGIMEVHKRKQLGTWILIHFVLLILELIFYCLSIWQVDKFYEETDTVRPSF